MRKIRVLGNVVTVENRIPKAIYWDNNIKDLNGHKVGTFSSDWYYGKNMSGDPCSEEDSRIVVRVDEVETEFKGPHGLNQALKFIEAYIPVKRGNWSIDQTHFVKLQDYEHIYVDVQSRIYPVYYFCDETTDAHGPWLTAGEAEAQHQHYCKYVL